MCKQSPFQNLGGGGGGGKVNQRGYVASHLYMDEFQEIGFLYEQAESLFCGQYSFIVVKAINSIN